MVQLYNELDPENNNFNKNFFQNLELYKKKLEEFINFSSFLNKGHWRICMIRIDLIDVYIQTKNYKNAINLLLEQMKIENLILPRYHNLKLTTYNTLQYIKNLSINNQEKEEIENILYFSKINWDIYSFIINKFPSL